MSNKYPKVAILTPIHRLDSAILKNLKETDAHLRNASNKGPTFTWIFFINNSLTSFDKFKLTIKENCSYNRIKFVDMLSESYTLGMCRNFAARYAWVNGYDYMTYLDSDDSLDVRIPNKVFDDNPDVIMFTSHRRNSGDKTDIITTSKETIEDIDGVMKEKQKTLPEALLYLWIRSRGIYQYMWNLIINTNYFNRNNIAFGDQFVFEDVKAFMELLDNNPKVKMIKLSPPCYTRNARGDSMSNTVSDRFKEGLVTCGKFLLDVDPILELKFFNLCNYAKIKGISDEDLDAICMEVSGKDYETMKEGQIKIMSDLD